MKQTILYPEHVKLKGKLINYAGWEMPVYYSSIINEHLGVRNQAGLFDIAHLGRIKISGPDAFEFIQYITTNDIYRLGEWKIQYNLIANESGGIMDDILLYHHPDGYLLVINAVNTDKILEHIRIHSKNRNIAIDDITNQTVLIAIQGPQAQYIINKYFSISCSNIKKYSFIFLDNLTLSRTGYTGEDGFEIIADNKSALNIWQDLLSFDKEFGLIPCGLGARDSLRIEAGNCLYGHEIGPDINPFEAGIGSIVKLDKGRFIGRDNLIQINNKGIDRKLVGLQMCNNSIPRENYLIQKSGEIIGKITSGTFSPLLKTGIALGYIPIREAIDNNSVDIIIRNKLHPAKIKLKINWKE